MRGETIGPTGAGFVPIAAKIRLTQMGPIGRPHAPILRRHLGRMTAFSSEWYTEVNLTTKYILCDFS